MTITSQSVPGRKKPGDTPFLDLDPSVDLDAGREVVAYGQFSDGCLRSRCPHEATPSSWSKTPVGGKADQCY